jgi:rare lipoprotein A
LSIGFCVGNYVYDLHKRFPHRDQSKAGFWVAFYLTRASWEHPSGRKLLVINVINWRWTICRVNDRGPGRRWHRAIDLSKTTFKKIASLQKGLIDVMIIPTLKKEKNYDSGFS